MKKEEKEKEKEEEEEARGGTGMAEGGLAVMERESCSYCCDYQLLLLFLSP